MRTSVVAAIFLGLCIFVAGEASAKEALKVAACQDYPPYTYAETVNGKPDNSKPTGFVCELAQAAFARMESVSVESFMIYPWKNGLMGTFKGKYDAIMPAITKPEREKFCYYPEEPVMTGEYTFFIRKSDAGKLDYKDFSDFKGHKVGILRGVALPDDFTAAGKQDGFLEEGNNATANMKKLAAGKLDFVLSNYSVGMETLKELKLEGKIVAVKKPFSVVKEYVIFSKKTVKPEVVQEFSKALTAFKQTDDYKKLCAKYKISQR